MPTESFGSSAPGEGAAGEPRTSEQTLELRGLAGPGAKSAGAGLPARFQFLSELARGGMGRVSVALDTVLHREVAVKEVLLHASPRAVARFEREALLTARLQHPGIVSVQEFGRKATGEPYLVMRRVRGEPLDKVIAKATTLEQRLALLGSFISIAETIAYAHDQGVVHRDLKPANALLGEFGETVVIDWGLAKDLRAPPGAEISGGGDEAVSEDDEETLISNQPGSLEAATPSTQLTRHGQVLGTPAYMSPEQARGEPAGEKSDVYALGAMLFQLLTGRRPYLQTDATSTLRAILAGPPAPLAEVAPGVAPELASVVERAMARDPALRLTAKELAAELRAFLAGQLVSSHRYSRRERVARFVRRNLLPLVLSSAFLVVLAGSGVVAVRRVLKERDRANLEARMAQQTTNYLTKLFQAASPAVAQGKTVTARDLLDQGRKQIDTLSKEPEIQAQLALAIGRSYNFLGESDAALALVERSRDLRLRLLGPDHPDTLDAQAAIISVLTKMGKYREALKVEEEVLERRRRTLGPEDQKTLQSMTDMAGTLGWLGRNAEALELETAVLAVQRRVLAPDDRSMLNTVDALATTSSALGDLASAEKYGREGLEKTRARLGVDHPATLVRAMNLADTLCELGRGEEGEALHRDTIERTVRVQGRAHPLSIYAIWSSSVCQMHQQKWAAAEAPAREAIELQQKAGFDPPMLLARKARLASTVAHQGRVAEAVAQAEETLHLLDGTAEKNFNTWFALGHLARTWLMAGDRAKALSLLQRAIDEGSDLPTLELERSPDFDPLRADPAFARLLASVKRPASR